MNPSATPFGRTFQPHLEPLERRLMLAAIPFGATVDDTAEVMLGDVFVSVVLFESDGSIDDNLEDWNPNQIAAIKQTVRDGLDWWEDALDRQDSVHDLNFEIDFTYADSPISTGYEPIQRRSNDFAFWVEDFFNEVGLTEIDSFSNRIREFNHAQRIKHETHWAFTIFVVNAESDVDHRFHTDGSFSLAFSFAGGQAFVMTSERPASTVAHETAHMFWGMDEYEGSRSYHDHRGYYDTQNLNAYDDNPNPAERVRSILSVQGLGYTRNAISPSAMESIGWKDSDEDGVFDILDVPLNLNGSGQFDAASLEFRFSGSANVATLPNLNPSGTGNDITLNKISRIEYRTDNSDWQTAQVYDQYSVDVQLEIRLSPSAEFIELRASDDATGITSDVIRSDIQQQPQPPWQNPEQATDVNADGFVSPRDALLVINDLNKNKARQLPTTRESSASFFDVNGDGFISPIDSLIVINELNQGRMAAVAADRLPEGELGSALDRHEELSELSKRKPTKITFNVQPATSRNPANLQMAQLVDYLFSI